MNQKLVYGSYDEYFPFILKLYETKPKCIFDIEKSTLYKGIIVDENVWLPFLEKFPSSKNNKLPTAILYGASFFSFFKDKKLVEKSKKKRKGEIQRFDLFIWLILEGTNNFRFIKNQACISQEVSYYNSNDEVLFFPFSCFESKRVEKKEDKEYVITLNYLDKYLNEFTAQERKTFKNVNENDYSKMILNSGLINKDLINMPFWFRHDIKIIPNDKRIITLL